MASNTRERTSTARHFSWRDRPLSMYMKRGSRDHSRTDSSAQHSSHDSWITVSYRAGSSFTSRPHSVAARSIAPSTRTHVIFDEDEINNIPALPMQFPIVQTMTTKVRQATVRIANLKTDLADLELSIERANAKQRQLASLAARTKSLFLTFPGRSNTVCKHLSALPRPLKPSPSGSLEGLPEVLFPEFQFDGESGGTFRRNRTSQAPTVSRVVDYCTGDHQLPATRPLSSISSVSSLGSDTTEGRPPLTYDGSSMSTLSTNMLFSPMTDDSLLGFPTPPSKTFSKAANLQRLSEISVVTTTSEYEMEEDNIAILDAKHEEIPRRSPNPAAVVQIRTPTMRAANSHSTLLPAALVTDRSSVPNMASHTTHAGRIAPPRDQRRPTSTRSADSKATRAHSRIISWEAKAARHRESLADPMLEAIAFAPAPRGTGTADVHTPSIYNGSPIERSAKARCSVVASAPLNYVSRKSVVVPPRTSSLFQGLRISMPGTDMLKDVGNDPGNDRITAVARSGQVQGSSITPRSPTAPANRSPTFEDIIAGNKPRPSKRGSRLDRLSKFYKRCSSKNTISKVRRPQTLRAWLPSLALTTQRRRGRNSNLTTLTSEAVEKDGAARFTAHTLPLPFYTRGSHELQFELNLMGTVANPNRLSREASLVSMSARTLRTLRRASMQSSSTSGTRDAGIRAGSMLTFAPSGSDRTSSTYDRHYGREPLTAPTVVDTRLKSPRVGVMRSFLERPAADRRLPSLTELP